MAANQFYLPEDSPTGKKLLIIALKSLDSEEFPPNQGIVRAKTLISGYYVEEVEPGKLDVHFLLESDFKISLFVQKQVAPKNANYSYFMKKWLEQTSKE